MNAFYEQLAPQIMTNHKKDRFTDDGFGITMQDFTPNYQAILTTLYQRKKSVYDLWLYMCHSPDFTPFEHHVDYFAGKEPLNLDKKFGERTHEQRPPPELTRKVVLGVRGGALTSMVFTAETIKRRHLI